MKKLLNVVLVMVLVASFVFGVMATDSFAKKDQCYTYCDGIYQVKCCRGVAPATTGGWSCWYTGLFCA